MVTIDNEKVLLKDGDILDIDGIKIDCILVPGHTWRHMVYLIDDKYLFKEIQYGLEQTEDTASFPPLPKTMTCQSNPWKCLKTS